MSLIVTPLRYRSLIMNRLSTLSIGGPLLSSVANWAIVLLVQPPDQSGEFYSVLLGDYYTARDTWQDLSA
jgi:hypothetical protein